MKRDRLRKLAGEKRFIPGIYNYCDRWCERCPQTARCLTFAVEEEDSDPEARDIRNEAFWKKMSGIFEETLELLKESAKEWGIDITTLDAANELRREKVKREAAENHLLCRAARSYSERVEDWLKKKEAFLFETAAASREGVDLDEAFEVIRWYQSFVCAKIMRAIRGAMEDKEEPCDEFPSDSDGSAKIALIAIDRSIAAWAVVQSYCGEEALGIIAFLDHLRQAVEKAFPKARSFIRPGFDSVDLNT